jgi:hypothetical protein
MVLALNNSQNVEVILHQANSFACCPIHRQERFPFRLWRQLRAFAEFAASFGSWKGHYREEARLASLRKRGASLTPFSATRIGNSSTRLA